jgi:hypothetical protein
MISDIHIHIYIYILTFDLFWIWVWQQWVWTWSPFCHCFQKQALNLLSICPPHQLIHNLNFTWLFCPTKVLAKWTWAKLNNTAYSEYTYSLFVHISTCLYSTVQLPGATSGLSIGCFFTLV